MFERFVVSTSTRSNLIFDENYFLSLSLSSSLHASTKDWLVYIREMPEGTRRKHSHSLILKTTRALPEIASNCRQQSTVMNLTILRGVMLIFCFVVLSGLNINRYLFETHKFSIYLPSFFILLFNF